MWITIGLNLKIPETSWRREPLLFITLADTINISNKECLVYLSCRLLGTLLFSYIVSLPYTFDVGQYYNSNIRGVGKKT